MKGIPLNTRITTSLAMLCAIIMAVLAVYESWSQHHLTSLDPLFYACMGLIVLTYAFASAEHPDVKLIVGSFSGAEVRIEHLFRINAYLFLGVLIFGVNNSETWIQFLHFFFTIAAIVQGYVTILLWSKNHYKPKTQHLIAISRAEEKKVQAITFSFFATFFGISALIMGFTTDIISLSWGEVGAALPLAIFMFTTVKKQIK